MEHRKKELLENGWTQYKDVFRLSNGFVAISHIDVHELVELSDEEHNALVLLGRKEMQRNAFRANIGKMVAKMRSNKNPKPFKSQRHVNTVKGVITHPILQIPAYVFEEDDSYVECRRCIVV